MSTERTAEEIQAAKTSVQREIAALKQRIDGLEDGLSPREILAIKDLLIPLHNQLAALENQLAALENQVLELRKQETIKLTTASNFQVDEVGRQFATLTVKSGPASGFTASANRVANNCGYTASFPQPFMYPPLVKDILEMKCSYREIEEAKKALKNALAVSVVPCKIHETENKTRCEFTVQSISGNLLENLFTALGALDIQCEREKELQEFFAVNVVATGKSKSDCVAYSSLSGKIDVGLAVMELKDTAYAPLEQMGQNYSEGANLCLGQAKLGLSYDKCCVAIVASNGCLYQFGFVTLLEPAFPVLHVTSYVIDCSSEKGREEAGMHLVRIVKFCEAQNKLLQTINLSVRKSIDSVMIDWALYHAKPISKVFPRHSIRMRSLLSLYEIFQRLHDRNIEEAVLPIALLSGDFCESNYLSNDSLIFPKLSDEFKMGVPSDADDFLKYSDKLKMIYKKFHDAGVVHVDGYPSNIMWKKDAKSREIIVRFVDWDVATFINTDFDQEIRNRLLTFRGQDLYWPGNKHSAQAQHDAWFVFIFSQMTQDERLQSTRARTPQDVVRCYVAAGARIRDSNPNLLEDFDKWFETNW